MKIVISGYYGFGNAGDEAILTALIRRLRERLPEAEIVVLSAAPTETAGRFGVRAIDRWNLLQIRRELRSADALLSGGGGLIQDETSRRSPYYYLGLIALARRHCPVYAVGQGIGPLHSQIAYRWAGRVLRHVDFSLVRDEPSARLLRHWGLPADRIVCAGDLAWLLRPDVVAVTDQSASSYPEESAQQQGARGCPDAEDGRPYVIVALKGGKRQQQIKLYEAMAHQLNRLSRDADVNIIFLAFHPRQDGRVSEEVAARMEHPALVLSTSTIDLHDLLGCIGRAEALVGM
jgi:polysaccharide pyruvyl transferase CsaB